MSDSTVDSASTHESPVGEAPTTAAAIDGSDSAANDTVKLTKAQRKKANRKAKKKATNLKVTTLLTECNTLTHRDVFSSQWFHVFQRYKRSYRIYYFNSSELNQECIDWMMLLTTINMKQMYENAEGWGWNEKEKRSEFTHTDARFFIVTQLSDAELAAASSSDSSSATADVEEGFIGSPVAFAHIRFTTGDADAQPIAYLYELQLEPSLQRQGIGRFLMSLVELFAWRCQMRRVVLTVFRENEAATRFYTQTLNYTLDDTDPELWEQEVDYQILAKRNRKMLEIEDIMLPLINKQQSETTNVAAAESSPAP